MSLPAQHDIKGRVRLRVQAININPATPPKGATRIELLVDEDQVFKSTYVGRGKQLRWANAIICDVFASTRVKLRIVEKQALGTKVVLGTLDSYACRLIGVTSTRLFTADEKFTADFAIATHDMISDAHDTAVAQLHKLRTRPGRPDEQGANVALFEYMLSILNVMIELRPYAKYAYTQYVKALDQIDQNGGRNKHLADFIASLAKSMPPVNTLEVALGLAEHADTITSLLHVIEDASSLAFGDNSNIKPGMIIGRWVQSSMAVNFPIASAQLIDQVERLITILCAGLAASTLAHYSSDDALILRTLQPANCTWYDLRRVCLAGTRRKAIDYIKAWCRTGLQSSQILWIHGQLGTGKSSVAMSVCQELVGELDCTLAASVFCQRDDPELNDPDRVLGAVLYGVAARHPSFGTRLAEILRDSKRETDEPNNGSCVTLAKGAIDSMEDMHPSGELVVIVDAIDECGTNLTRMQLLDCLSAMCQHAPWFKVVVTSRCKADILKNLDQPMATLVTSYDIDEDDTASDISLFLRTKLAGVAAAESCTEIEIDRLCTRSDGLFLWASAACDHILGEGECVERLRHLEGDVDCISFLKPLDIRYNDLMKGFMIETYGDDSREVAECLAVIMATSSRTPLTLGDLTRLATGYVQPMTLARVMIGLNLTPDISRSLDAAVCVTHASLMSFLTSPLRSGRFHVDMAPANCSLSQMCLDIMSKELRFNICGLQNSHQLNREVVDLEARVSSAITPALAYSCLHWVSHLCDGKAALQSQGGWGAVKAFLMGPTLLYWIEALSLLGILEHGLSALLQLTGVTATSDESVRLDIHEVIACAWDAYRFVAEFHVPISESTPHLYVSALAFAPTNTRMSRLFRHHFPNTVLLRQGGMSNWRPSFNIMQHSSSVSSLALSTDGTRLASGCEDGSLRLWNAVTGVCSSEMMQAHFNSISCVSFAPNGQILVSGSQDGKLKVWDSKGNQLLSEIPRSFSSGVTCISHSFDGRMFVSGSHDTTLQVWNTRGRFTLKGTLRGHRSSISSVAFSPTSRLIVSGSLDKCVCIWDAESQAQILGPLTGHSLGVSAVAFSPDGSLVASGSWDKTIVIWGVSKGDILHALPMGEYGSVSCLAFSGDSQRVASGSYKNGIQIWDFKSKTVALKLDSGRNGCTTSVVYTLDGKRLIGASSDRTVRVWDTTRALNDEEETPHVLPHTINTIHNDMKQNEPEAIGKTLTGHSQSVDSVAFSPDGRRIVSGSADKTLRMWDAETGSALGKPLTGHPGSVLSVAFSPDGRRVVSGSSDKTLRMWDAETGAALGKPLTGHSNWVRSVAFSPDGRRIVSGSHDKTLRIWDVSSSSLHFPEAASDFQQQSDDGSWVTFSGSPRLLWLPAEYRQRKPAYMAAAAAGQESEAVLLDFSRFVHGTAWAEVVGKTQVQVD